MARLDLVTNVIVKGQENLKNLNGDLAKADQNVGKIGKTVKTGLAFAGGITAALGLKEGIQFLGDAVNKAADFENTVSAAGQVMGDEAVPALKDWAKQASRAFGASEQLALDSAVQMSVFAKSAGLAGDEAIDFSKEMTQLGGDLASFFGGSTEEAIGAIGAALRGESEPIRRYGVLLDDATLRQRAFEKGLISSTKQGLTPQIKVLAAQAEILAQTGDAQGDFVRTSEDMANVQKTLGAEFENIQKQIGEQLLPFFKDLAVFIRDTLIPTFGALGDVSDFISDIVNPIGAVLDRQQKEVEDHQKAEAKRLKAGEDAWLGYQQTIITASDEIKDTVREFTDSEIAAIEDHWDEVRAAGTETVVQYNVGIFEAQNSLKTEIDALMKVLDERMAPAEEIAYLRGKKAALQLALGAADAANDQPAVAAITLMISRINTQLNALNGYDKGKAFTRSFAAGLVDPVVIDFVKQSAYRVALAARGIFPSSEPKDPRSPFRGITDAFGFMDVFAAGLLKNDDVVPTALRNAFNVPGLSTALSVTGAGATTGPGGAGTTTVINNWYLRWDGEPPKGRNEAEVIAVLDRLTGLVDNMTVPS